MKISILAYPESAVPPHLRFQVLRLQNIAWPTAEPIVLQVVHDPDLDPLSMLMVSDRKVVAALDILSKKIVHKEEHYVASGLSCVVTSPDERGLGYGRKLVVAAKNMMEKNGADLSIFTCDRPLQHFYESSGWHVLHDAPIIGGTPDSPFPSDQFDKITMGCFFSAKAHLNAQAFSQCQIALYPGEIDRLW
ncbi:acetyltransferase (GNAT) family protein [Collimonas sp. PA-H2]|uniref:GNAT family N-acetyltransferase n=1 Tax=Collimonas sp. PA-H2 TaxID=1881062 RepID=UPI000C013A83|nr:GNAT family N-acetyltransferase [Collimonas sp. PA-H2]PFH04390.1 acetyltransferase (GNAT) family protein [Collimonas sp. PA-H2]